MDKEGLLKLLQEAEVQQAIRMIVQLPVVGAGPIAMKKSAMQQEKELVALKAAYEDDLARQERENSELVQANRHLVAENEELRQTNQVLEKDKQKGQTDLAVMAQALERVQQEKDACQRENLRLEWDVKQKKQSLGGLEEKNAALSHQLQQRFSRGWQLFGSYQRIDAHVQQLLHSVFTQPDHFEAFICGCAQDMALEKIWDVMKSCAKGGNLEDKSILWDVFCYCIDLVNMSKTEKIYEILAVQLGDEFDLEEHTLAPGSPAQGSISKILLPGYRNVYSGHIERKSLVSIS